jgi:hypothetical protein
LLKVATRLPGFSWFPRRDGLRYIPGMGDQPSAEALLRAMAATLADQVVPNVSGGPRHSARVVANLCTILARELASPGPGEVDEQLRALLTDRVGADVMSGHHLPALLDERLREGDEQFAVRALPILRLDVERRLAISKPSYLHPGSAGGERA